MEGPPTNCSPRMLPHYATTGTPFGTFCILMTMGHYKMVPSSKRVKGKRVRSGHHPQDCGFLFPWILGCIYFSTTWGQFLRRHNFYKQRFMCVRPGAFSYPFFSYVGPQVRLCATSIRSRELSKICKRPHLVAASINVLKAMPANFGQVVVSQQTNHQLRLLKETSLSLVLSMGNKGRQMYARRYHFLILIASRADHRKQHLKQISLSLVQSVGNKGRHMYAFVNYQFLIISC